MRSVIFKSCSGCSQPDSGRNAFTAVERDLCRKKCWLEPFGTSKDQLISWCFCCMLLPFHLVVTCCYYVNCSFFFVSKQASHWDPMKGTIHCWITCRCPIQQIGCTLHGPILRTPGSGTARDGLFFLLVATLNGLFFLIPYRFQWIYHDLLWFTMIYNRVPFEDMFQWRFLAVTCLSTGSKCVCLLLRSFRSWFSCVILTMIVVCIPVISLQFAPSGPGTQISLISCGGGSGASTKAPCRHGKFDDFMGVVGSLILNLELGPFGHIWTIMLEEVWHLCNGERHSFFQQIKDTGDFENCCLKGMATSRTFWVHPR